MVGHLLQYHPVFMKLKEMVADGALGRLRYMYSRRLSLGKLRSAENVLWSFAPHDISMTLTLAGEEPCKVHGIAASYLQDKISDFASVHLSFPNGVHGHVEILLFAYIPSVVLWAYGPATYGYFIIETTGVAVVIITFANGRDS